MRRRDARRAPETGLRTLRLAYLDDWWELPCVHVLARTPPTTRTKNPGNMAQLPREVAHPTDGFSSKGRLRRPV
jgi:hypothetical protein